MIGNRSGYMNGYEKGFTRFERGMFLVASKLNQTKPVVAIQVQEKLGWQAFLKGNISLLSMGKQQQYYQWLELR